MLLPVLAALLALGAGQPGAGAAGAPLDSPLDAPLDSNAVEQAPTVATVAPTASPPPSTLGRLHCVCSPGECEPLDEDQCPGGAVWDACRCCRLCARVEDEPCGGPHGFHGACADGLRCVVKGRPIREAREEGVCTKVGGSCRDSDAILVSGCNIVGPSCDCGRAPLCPGDGANDEDALLDDLENGLAVARPFAFDTKEECDLNLGVMLDAERQAYEDM